MLDTLECLLKKVFYSEVLINLPDLPILFQFSQVVLVLPLLNLFLFILLLFFFQLFDSQFSLNLLLLHQLLLRSWRRRFWSDVLDAPESLLLLYCFASGWWLRFVLDFFAKGYVAFCCKDVESTEAMGALHRIGLQAASFLHSRLSHLLRSQVLLEYFSERSVLQSSC